MMLGMEEKRVRPGRTLNRTILLGSGLGTVVWLVVSVVAAVVSKAGSYGADPYSTFPYEPHYAAVMTATPFVVVSAMNVLAWRAFPITKSTRWRIVAGVVLRTAVLAPVSVVAVSVMFFAAALITLFLGPNIP